MPSLQRRDFDDIVQRSSEYYQGSLENRSPQTTSDRGNLSLGAPDVERNASTTEACMQGMQNMGNVSNAAGFTACYNILDWHENMGGMFQADLRIFQYSQATGQFANIPTNYVNVQLTYPNSTQFSILMNSKRSLERRQNGIIEIQQYSLVGNFKMQLDFKKLNETELMSLLIPQISLNADIDGGNIETQMVPTEIVYFVTGQFKGQATSPTIIQAANPAMAALAIDISKGFVLPGTSFGIFPTGLIVTGTWCVLFLLAFGLGTFGRMRHRDIYRRRVAATSRMGKR